MYLAECKTQFQWRCTRAKHRSLWSNRKTTTLTHRCMVLDLTWTGPSRFQWDTTQFTVRTIHLVLDLFVCNVFLDLLQHKMHGKVVNTSFGLYSKSYEAKWLMCLRNRLKYLSIFMENLIKYDVKTNDVDVVVLQYLHHTLQEVFFYVFLSCFPVVI